MGVIAARCLDYARLSRFDRPAGALLLLWPTLSGLWIAAAGFPGWYWLSIFTVGVFVMRAFGCVVNDIMDRRLDAVVARTRQRPLAAGRIHLWEAVMVGGLFLLVAAIIAGLLPPVARWWAVAGFVLTLFYPLAKHLIIIPQLVLAVVFNLGILLAYAALHNASPTLPSWFFFIGNGLWVMAYDTIYAMADRDDDRAHGGVYSSALFFGHHDVMIVSLFYVGTILWLSAGGVIFNYGVAYQVALIAAMLSVFRFRQWYKTRLPAACMAAFRANHLFGLFIFAGIFAAFR